MTVAIGPKAALDNKQPIPIGAITAPSTQQLGQSRRDICWSDNRLAIFYDQFDGYARGGYHGNNAGDGGTGCEGTAYKGDQEYDGGVRFAKEQWHSNGYSFTSFQNTT